jgi:ankyrin repeat protein
LKNLTEAVLSGNVDAVAERLGAGDDVNERDGDHRTPLMHAAIDGNADLVRLLTASGADVDTRDRSGFSALHFAAQDFNLDVVRALLDAGAEVDVEDSFGNTPLGRAVFNSKGRGEMIQLLLSRGADKTRKNRNGVSPLDLARSVSNYDLRKYLE